jgi:hypothetical protein
MFDHWAQPVTAKRWAFVTVALWHLYRLSGGRFFGHSKHAAWQKATGI